ncbi:MAG: glycosyltransferase [Candidatus Methylomirabilales bacterium]
MTVGFHSQPFERLLGWIEEIARSGAVDESFLVQRGSSRFPMPHCAVVDFLEMDEFDRMMRECRAVVCHAGTGSVIAALDAGKCPIVVPRRRRYQEAYHDLQPGVARELERRGLARFAESKEEVFRHLFAVQEDAHAVLYRPRNGLMLRLVDEFLRDVEKSSDRDRCWRTLRVFEAFATRREKKDGQRDS